MKKLVSAALALLLLAAFAACGNKPANPGNTGLPEGDAFFYEPRGVKIVMGREDAAAVLAGLGEPRDAPFEDPSCAIPGAMDTIYNYGDFELRVTDDQGVRYLTGVTISSDAYPTPEGVRIGSSLEEVTAALGTGYTEQNDFYKYTRGGSTLEIAIVNGAVGQIMYNAIF